MREHIFCVVEISFFIEFDMFNICCCNTFLNQNHVTLVKSILHHFFREANCTQNPEHSSVGVMHISMLLGEKKQNKSVSVSMPHIFF